MKFELNFLQSFSIWLKISRSDILNKATELIGVQDIKINNSEFDKTFTIKGYHENEIQVFLTSVWTKKIMVVSQSMKRLVINDESLSWITKGVIREPIKIVALVTQLVELTDILTSGSSNPQK